MEINGLDILLTNWSWVRVPVLVLSITRAQGPAADSAVAARFRQSEPTRRGSRGRRILGCGGAGIPRRAGSGRSGTRRRDCGRVRRSGAAGSAGCLRASAIRRQSGHLPSRQGGIRKAGGSGWGVQVCSHVQVNISSGLCQPDGGDGALRPGSRCKKRHGPGGPCLREGQGSRRFRRRC